MMTPDTVLQQRLRLIDNGWRIIPLQSWPTPGLKKGELDRKIGKAPVTTGWQRSSATADDLDGAFWQRSTSTGIVCGKQRDGSHLLAVDIDILDAPLSIEVADKAQEILGPSPLLRIGRDPKRLLVYQVKYAASKFKFGEGGIELLGEGNQFVSFGIHPDTHRPYSWPNGDSPENTALEDVPATTPEKVAALVDWLHERLTPLQARRHDGEGQHDDQPITVDQDGLVSDGRERLLRDIVWREFHSMAAPTQPALTDAVWATFCRQARTDDGRWSRRDAAHKVSDVLRKWRDGKVEHQYVAPFTVPAKPTVTVKEAEAQLEAAVLAFVAEADAWWVGENARQANIDAMVEAARKAAKLEFEFSDDDYKKAGVRMRAALAREEAERLHPQVPPPVGVLFATTGAGKSELLRRVFAKHLQRDNRNAVTTFAPEHTLTREASSDFTTSTSIPSRVYLGAKQVDPDYDDGRLMCQYPELIDAALRLRVSLDQVCAPHLPGHENCGRSRQVKDPPRAWFEASAMLYRPRPKAIPKPTLQFIDEAFAAGAVDTFAKLAVTTFTNADLSDVPTMQRGELADAYAKANEAFMAATEKAKGSKMVQFPVAEFVAAGLDADTCAAARAIEWKRKPEPPSLDGSPEDMLATLLGTESRFNFKLPLFWKLAEEALRGDHAVAVNIDLEPAAKLADGEGTVPKLWLYGRRDIHPDRMVPTLIADATGRMELIRELFPQAKLLADLEIEAPHLEQVWIRHPFTKQRLVQDYAPDADPLKNATRRNHVAALHRALEVIAASHRTGRNDGKPDVLVVVNGKKDKTAHTVETELLAVGPLPSNVELRHYNTLRGVNRYSDVAAIVLIGATRPDIKDSHRQAERLARRPLDRNDPLVKATAWVTTEGEQIQVIGRGRPIRRTATNPLTVYRFNDVALHLPVDREVSWKDAQPTPAELLAARELVLDCPVGAKGYLTVQAAMLPDLFKDAQAAKDAAKSSRGDLPISIYPIGKLPRESWTPYTAKAPGSRYGVPVLVRPGGLAAVAAKLELTPRSPEKQDGAGAPPPLPPIVGSVGIVLDPVQTTACGTVDQPDPPPPRPPARAPVPAGATVDAAELLGEDADPWDDYDGGVLPDALAELVRARWRASPLSQQQLADRVGISRPQLANALQGRFGLSAGAAARLRSVVVDLPTTPQHRLL